ncbi:hypothetical protein [Streptomyces collinus]|uniref:Uncharacterized protein n=1 Tax=Streptomyces collinus TaxID=42684 RepID=A0AA89QE65_STRCU|nr:hypothetical protein [Streptomyces collinus]MBB5816885.1 hypothetical protein [Streptomyces collinus]WMX61880.1 hypothetical protein RFN52_00255 [Streptomyces collinus]
MTRPTRRTPRRLVHAASFAMLRGAAYATGSTVMTILLLWLVSR